MRTEFSDYYFDKNIEMEMVEEEVGKEPSIEDIYLESSRISGEEFRSYTQEIRRSNELMNERKKADPKNQPISVHLINFDL